ncbi:MAG TPA: hypothetical protein VGF58_08425 [Burkholderiales bacterium]|jgi:hypothetical protein
MDLEQWLTDLVEAAQLAPSTVTFEHGPAVFICDPAATRGSAGVAADQIDIALLR